MDAMSPIHHGFHGRRNRRRRRGRMRGRRRRWSCPPVGENTSGGGQGREKITFMQQPPRPRTTNNFLRCARLELNQKWRRHRLFVHFYVPQDSIFWTIGAAVRPVTGPILHKVGISRQGFFLIPLQCARILRLRRHALHLIVDHCPRAELRAEPYHGDEEEAALRGEGGQGGKKVQLCPIAFRG